MWRFLFFVMMIAVCAPAGGVWADDPVALDYSAVPDEFIQEAEEFFDYCEGRESMRLYYNCECLAIEYLDERVLAGEGPSRNELILRINRECLDATEAAGVEFQRCTNSLAYPYGVDPEAYCECIGNMYAEMFEVVRMPPSSRVHVAIRTETANRCRRQLSGP